MSRDYLLTNKIREYRIARDLTQSELASLTGVSKNTISAFETGFFCPSAHTALLLCKVLRVKFEDLFFLEV